MLRYNYKLTSWNTCVESKSGLNLNDATTSIPERVKGMDSGNTVVLHLGTNDIDFTNIPGLAVKYSHLIRKIRSSAPDCSDWSLLLLQINYNHALSILTKN